MPRFRVTVLWRLAWTAGICLAVFNVYVYMSSQVDVTSAQLQENREAVIRFMKNPDTPNSEGSRLSLDIPLVSEMKDTIHEYGWAETQTIRPLCQAKIKNANVSDFPDVSVIISFHEVENVTNVLRTVQAILVRTPEKLLREIILVDDNTFKEDLRSLLPLFVNARWRSHVRIIQSDVQLGLIQARLLGIRHAKGTVVMVMDGHMEVQPLWLEPLLYEIQQNPQTMASPHMDWIERKGRKWKYRHGASSWSTHFDWSMVFGFFSSVLVRPEIKTDPTEPIRSSTTVGTFAIRRDFFLKIGAFDEGMQMWGGENIDLSIRVWLFGGRVVSIPCSHIAHVEAPNSRKYRDGWTKYIHHNYKRLVDVWFDNYAQYFYKYFPLLRKIDVGDLSERKKLKESSPHNFTWFLHNVIPELGLPGSGQAWGGVANMEMSLCMRALPHQQPLLAVCRDTDPYQDIYLDTKNHLRLPLYIIQTVPAQSKTTCDDWPKYVGSPVIEGDEWTLTENSFIRSNKFNKCLTAGPLNSAPGGTPILLQDCDPANSLQQWDFRHYKGGNKSNKLESEHTNLSQKNNITHKKRTLAPENRQVPGHVNKDIKPTTNI